MAWTARLGGQFTVVRGEEPLGPPPTRLAAVLLVGLLLQKGEWLGRTYLASRLYPLEDVGTARTALRQTLYRMRQWLGEDAIRTSGDYLQLAEGWETDFRGVQEGVHLAPGLTHEWVEEARLAWTGQPAPTITRDNAFVHAVKATAAVDPDEARGLLAGCHSFVYQLGPVTVRELLGMTEPATEEAPFAPGFYELQGLYEFGMCAFSAALQNFQKAYRLAVEQGQQKDAARAGAGVLFGYAETGMARKADTWRGRLASQTTCELTLGNAVAAETWNRNELGEALELMAANSVNMATASRAERLHFWTNFATLAAEAGDIDASRMGEEQCLAEDLGGIDQRWHDALLMVSAWQCLQLRDADEAIRLVNCSPDRGWPLYRSYRDELLAIAYAAKGDRANANARWAAACRMRGNVPLNPRRQALHRRMVMMLP